MTNDTTEHQKFLDDKVSEINRLNAADNPNIRGPYGLALRLSSWIDNANEYLKKGDSILESLAELSKSTKDNKPDLHMMHNVSGGPRGSTSFSNSTEQKYEIEGNIQYNNIGKSLEHVIVDVKHNVEAPEPLNYMSFIETTNLMPKQITVLLGEESATVSMIDYKGDKTKESIDSYILQQAKLNLKKQIADKYHDFAESFESGFDEELRNQMVDNRFQQDQMRRDNLDTEYSFQAVAINYNDNDIAYTQVVKLPGSTMVPPNTATIQIEKYNEAASSKLSTLLEYAFKPIA